MIDEELDRMRRQMRTEASVRYMMHLDLLYLGKVFINGPCPVCKLTGGFHRRPHNGEEALREELQEIKVRSERIHGHEPSREQDT